MPNQAANGAMLERCCVQFGQVVPCEAPQLACAHTTAFLEHHARKYPAECAAALVYRVAESADGGDRLGAWLQLDTAVRLGIREQHALHKVHRNRAKTNGHQATTNGITPALHASTNEDEALPIGSSTANGKSNGDAVEEEGGSRYCAMLDTVSSYLPALIRFRWDEAQAPEKHRPSYRVLREGWSRVFRSSIAREIQAAVDQRRTAGPNTEPVRHDALRVPEPLVDALWKLRRESPRPSTARYVADVYELSVNVDGHKLSRQGHRRYPAIHPRVLEWVQQLYDAGETYCLLCDVWTHAQSRCPATAEHVAALRPIEASAARDILGVGGSTSNGLSANGPGRMLKSIQWIDHVVDLMEEGRPFEQYLGAVDTLRGRVTSSGARSSMMLLASYRLRPSALIPVDGGAQAKAAARSVQQLHAHLVVEHRRLREFNRLRMAIDVLAAEFAGIRPPRLNGIVPTCDERPLKFVFSVVGLPAAEDAGRHLGGPKSAAEDAAALQKRMDMPASAAFKTLPYAKDMRSVGALIGTLCPKFLTPGRAQSKCPVRQGRTSWDYAVAQELLRQNNIDVRNGGSAFVEEAAAKINRLELGDASSASAAMELRLALHVLGRGAFTDSASISPVPFCTKCMVFGHDRLDCIDAGHEVLQKEGLGNFAVARLAVGKVERILTERKAKAAHPSSSKNDVLEAREFASAVRLARRQVPYSQEMVLVLKQLEALVTPTGGLLCPLDCMVVDPAGMEQLLRDEGHVELKPTALVRDPRFPLDDIVQACFLQREASDLDRQALAAKGLALVDTVFPSTGTEAQRVEQLTMYGGTEGEAGMLVARIQSNVQQAKEKARLHLLQINSAREIRAAVVEPGIGDVPVGLLLEGSRYMAKRPKPSKVVSAVKPTVAPAPLSATQSTLAIPLTTTVQQPHEADAHFFLPPTLPGASSYTPPEGYAHLAIASSTSADEQRSSRLMEYAPPTKQGHRVEVA